METKIAFCKSLDMNGLKSQIGSFYLKKLNLQEIKKYYLFEYKNEKGFSWKALYDDEVKDFTVFIKTRLLEFNDISFISIDGDVYWRNILEKYENSILKTLVKPEMNFTTAYKRKGLLTWDYKTVLPDHIKAYELTIAPDKAIQGINGTYYIVEYAALNDKTGLVICYNLYRDEFFGELYKDGIAIVTHVFDCKSIVELEKILSDQLSCQLETL